MQPLQKFNDCETFLTERLKRPLPGQEAQLKMAPPFRGNIMPKVMKDYRQGAVMLLLHNLNNIPHIIFIERADDGKVHSGQIAFPGGKKDESDSTLLTTALRETEEEIGLTSQHITVAGGLTQLYIPPSNFMVNPYVGLLADQTKYFISPTEVKRIIEIPLFDFFAPGTIATDEVVTTYRGPVHVPCYLLHGVKIWGASSMILSEFLSLFDEVQ